MTTRRDAGDAASAASARETSGLEAVIGLEVHVQLRTRTKMFCGDVAAFGDPPNTHVCPVCLGLPGALPVVNGEAVKLAVRAALGLGCTVHSESAFARKSYFYPDLPKGYQITQYDRPLATGGHVAIPGPPGSATHDNRVRIRRLHLEEDAGRSQHDRLPGRTAVDLNRAGIPLMEIVTEPDIRSAAQARALLIALKQILEYLAVSDCDMEKGSLRVDANVSVRRQGDPELLAGTELKNLNSFAAVERALDYEIHRQREVLSTGRRVAPETRLWDESRGVARPMRAKEKSNDYRYFPEPDLPMLVVGAEEVARIRATLPELPEAKRARFAREHGLPDYDIEVLTATRETADFYEAVVAAGADAKVASNWVMTEVLGWCGRCGRGAWDLPGGVAAVAELLGLVTGGTLSNRMARRVFRRMAETGESPAAIVAAERLVQVGDEGRIRGWAREVIAEHTDAVERFRGGEERLMGFFMGQLMRRSRGKADPRKAAAILRQELAG